MYNCETIKLATICTVRNTMIDVGEAERKLSSELGKLKEQFNNLATVFIKRYEH